MEKQKILYESGNELAAYAAKQINYHVMGYYPITPSTQIAENLDKLLDNPSEIERLGKRAAIQISKYNREYYYKQLIDILQ